MSDFPYGDAFREDDLAACLEKRSDLEEKTIQMQDRREKGVKYFDGDNPKVKDIRPIIKLLKQIMAEKR